MVLSVEETGGGWGEDRIGMCSNLWPAHLRNDVCSPSRIILDDIVDNGIDNQCCPTIDAEGYNGISECTV